MKDVGLLDKSKFIQKNDPLRIVPQRILFYVSKR